MLAKESYGDIPNLKFMQGSTDDFPSEEQQFDVVFSNYVLHWVSDKEGALKRIYKSLKPGGKFGFIAVTGNGNDNFVQMLHLMGSERSKHFFSNLLHYKLMEWFETTAIANNFSVLYKNSFVRNYKFENIDETMDFWYGVTHGVFDPKLADKEELEKFKPAKFWRGSCSI